MSQPERVDEAMRDGSRDASTTASQDGSGCMVCGKSLVDTRAKVCSAAHRQLAYRLRQRRPLVSNGPDLRRELQRQRRLTAHTLYECPNCQERFVRERRCPSCRLFCRSLGLGGHCPECDQPILLADLLE